jgi:phosphomannomutase
MKTILFDLDGTLSESRKTITKKMAALLEEVSKEFIIGIVSGSDINFISEQIEGCFSKEFLDRLLVMPCNGTKKYYYDTSFQLEYTADMIKELGAEDYAHLLMSLFREQQSFMMETKVSTSCTGKFFDYRGSMLNWSPMGRDGDEKSRNRFVKYDKKEKYRLRTLKRLETYTRVNDINVSIKLGGDTSFDLYPTGWDKTYCLKHVNTSIEDIIFFGDRCYPGGNDYELSKKIKRSYQVKDPKETLTILRKILKEETKC